MNKPSLLTGEDRLDIMEHVISMGLFVDLRDFTRLSELYDDNVVFDYTSLFGGVVETYDRESFVGQLRGLLKWWNSTQHMMSNVLISGGPDDVEVMTHVRGVHTRLELFWIVGAIYTFKLKRKPEGWRIGMQKATLLYESDRDDIKQTWLSTLA